MMRASTLARLAMFSAALVLSTLVQAQEFTPEKDEFKSDKPKYSPYAGQHFPKRVFWGDTHLHTSNSPDAGLVGNTLPPEQAYRFARGDEVTSSTGLRAKLVRPLDWLVVSDHAEYIGLAPMIRSSDPALLADEYGKRLHDMFQAGPEQAYEAFIEVVASATRGEELIKNQDVKRTVWERFIGTADKYNDPGVFSAFIGFEWSSVPQGNNLHRVVVFRDDSVRAGRVVPYSLFDSDDPEDLWQYMSNYESSTGGQMLAIPHNGNLSNGMMFALNKMSGIPIDRAYAETRSRWEPIVEVTQIKGDGEAHPILSPEDAFADYGTWDKSNLAGTAPKEFWMLEYEYARPALKLGLRLGQRMGVNPFKFGMIGSTDSHTSLSTSREENYFGKFAQTEPAPERYKHYVIRSEVDDSLSTFAFEEVASGLAGVWATANTREAIFDAMKRREVYATTGTRIIVRVFGGWDFKSDEIERPDFAAQGYSRGVPMGGELSAAPRGKAPTFMIRALRDPDGANLDRVQMIKGWLDQSGELQEKVYDVALSGGREPGRNGEVPLVGSTVDVKDATFTNTIGDALLMTYWEDPDFDPDEHAFYYVRVIEIPTPSWLAFDAKRFGVRMPSDVPMTTQDRAYTSPIWYTP